MENASPSLLDDRDKYDHPADYLMGAELRAKEIPLIDARDSDGLL
jgi:hypothetical protein